MRIITEHSPRRAGPVEQGWIYSARQEVREPQWRGRFGGSCATTCTTITKIAPTIRRTKTLPGRPIQGKSLPAARGNLWCAIRRLSSWVQLAPSRIGSRNSTCLGNTRLVTLGVRAGSQHRRPGVR
jgi:hypothetical protein